MIDNTKHWRDQEPDLFTIAIAWEDDDYWTLSWYEAAEPSEFTDKQLVRLIQMGLFSAEDVGMTPVEWRKALRSRQVTWGEFMDLVSARRRAMTAKAS